MLRSFLNPACASLRIASILGLILLRIIVKQSLLAWLMRPIVLYSLQFLLIFFFVHCDGHLPVFKAPLHMEHRTSTIDSLPSLINPAGMLSTPGDFFPFNSIILCSTLVFKIPHSSSSLLYTDMVRYSILSSFIFVRFSCCSTAFQTGFYFFCLFFNPFIFSLRNSFFYSFLCASIFFRTLPLPNVAFFLRLSHAFRISVVIKGFFACLLFPTMFTAISYTIFVNSSHKCCVFICQDLHFSTVSLSLSLSRTNLACCTFFKLIFASFTLREMITGS